MLGAIARSASAPGAAACIRTQHPAPGTLHPIIQFVHRFFAPALDPGDEIVALPRDEADHLTHALRLGAGDAVTVFDGRGHECLARVPGRIGPAVLLHALSRVAPAPHPSLPLTPP